ncbi:DUF2442 domain-containing protein [Candidatus Thiosymbion oneisti]|uniref:DUF2442 domain-containing protein n=1 Tax=Candidatus Thiosymbion oneisti TaxID=589554 RepID=UPI000B278D0F|nr:DUF2442 domain-containing protein [Candidatus Thiosymbion oneisti]
MNITEIVPKNNYLLYIEADDGQAGLFDVAPYLESEAFAPLKDPGEFERIHNGNYFIEWECGADLSADTIETRWTPMTQPVSENETIHPVTVVTAFFDSKAKIS